MQEAMDGQFIPGDRGERILADAITTLSEAMRSRLEALDRNQQLLLEAVADLQWRIELAPSAAQALEAQLTEALRWTRPESEPPPYVMQVAP